MVDKNLFLYDLAIVAIFKDEGKYLKEWLDYHLIAGVDHFYLYNNDSSDNYEEILAPYVEKNLVTLIDFPGKLMQNPAYSDALERFRFFCRYMAFIDLDEFIFPRSDRNISEVVDEILSSDQNAQALGVSWHCFGSNGQKKADYSRGVLERFTRRADDNWEKIIPLESNEGLRIGNMYVKLIANPRSLKLMNRPHVGIHFGENYTVNEYGEKIVTYANERMSGDKIILNHYLVKSWEEYSIKKTRGYACDDSNPYDKLYFDEHDRNEVFDDGILKYRAARADKFSLESDADIIRRTEKALIKILTQYSPMNPPPNFLKGKFETFLTCRALAELLETKIGNKTAEEYALVWIYQSFVQKNLFTYAELQLFMSALPEILSRPFPICKLINQIAQEKIFPVIYNDLKSAQEWSGFYDFRYIQRLLNLI